MLLRFQGRFPHGTRNRGSALIGVLGVMGVTGVVALTITTMSLHAVGYTTSTRAGVQAEAAAEAGIDYAAAKLATAVCQPQYSSTTEPIFTVAISYSNLPTSPGDIDTSWVSGCPSSTSAQRLKLISTGTASSPGVAGNSSGNTRKVEAIYPYTPAPPANAIIPSGPALYSYAQTDPTMNNLSVNQAGTTRPSIQFLTGSLICASNTTIVADIILGAGSFATTSECIINGDLWASSYVTVQGGEIKGNVNSAGVQSGASVSLSNLGIVDGNIFAAGAVSINGKVGGNIVAGPSAGTSTFTSASSVGGSVISAGTVTAPARVIKGSVSVNKSGIVTPTIPFIPPWVDYAYSSNDWITASGAPYALLTMSGCSATALATSLTTVQNSLTPIILDTRACGAVTNLVGNLALKSDAVIIMNGFTLSSNDFESSDTSDKRLWLIIPDPVLDRKPTCPTNASAKILNHVMVGPHVGALIYSPCPIANGDDTWRGQMYTSSVGTSANFTLNYLPIGLPTLDLSTGQYLPPPGTGVLGSRISIRDLLAA